MEKALDVSDSTDWLTTALPALAPVESGLRCQVCKDFYTTPMITTCSHTFCSLCIRRCLAAEGKCPTCRAPEQEMKLRKNWAVQELVDAFQAARPSVMDIARQRKAEATEIPERPQKRKLQDINEENADERYRYSRKTRAQTRSVAAPSANSPMVIDTTDDEPESLDDGLVPCPMCGKRMKVESVYPHLDRCEQEQEEWKIRPPLKSTTKSSNAIGLTLQSPRRQSTPQIFERLPKLNYSILKENALRKKMTELGLNSWGSKSLLERRHMEWVNLWNANSDSIRPKTKRELLQELDVWERSQGGNAPVPFGSSNTGSAVMRKDFDGAGWAKSHDVEFQQLIANARKNRAAKNVVMEKNENDSALNTPPAVQSTSAGDSDHCAHMPAADETGMSSEISNRIDEVGTMHPESIGIGVIRDGVALGVSESMHSTSHGDLSYEPDLLHEPRVDESRAGPKSKYFREDTALPEAFAGVRAEASGYLPGRWSDEDSPGS